MKIHCQFVSIFNPGATERAVDALGVAVASFPPVQSNTGYPVVTIMRAWGEYAMTEGNGGWQYGVIGYGEYVYLRPARANTSCHGKDCHPSK